ncbi:hypothetical protein D3C71_78200 [compost metagenome]
MTYALETVRVQRDDGSFFTRRIMARTKPSKKVQYWRSRYDFAFSGPGLPFDNALHVEERRFLREWGRSYVCDEHERMIIQRMRDYEFLGRFLQGGLGPTLREKEGQPYWSHINDPWVGQPTWPWSVNQGLYSRDHGEAPTPYSYGAGKPHYSFMYFPPED